ncbi:acetyl-CoA C-acyltransferase [Aquicella lusitana]|uniref:Acetyl-CoA C-acetyltransferase n=1 Tax=Aquicella lusitana TaxID=254246 RepID=A0A370GKD7_9COXI|nr:acetyl-CoA C-acyltransferase [Aquicella lusitana]RDI43749.1 acetyl-CoA C-acetyltransferase [Aquicella lusitana]VVC74520.1 Acetyl-CoA acetyltransferase [Aquicella lusitana]
MHKDPIVIVSFARTPIGNLLGELKDFAGHQLGSHAIKAVIERSGLRPADIHEVIMGCVLPAGQRQAPARQAAINAGIPISTPCTTINKVCGSGMKAVMFAHDELLVGSNDVIIAGGMESMTNAPYLLLKARQGYRLGHGELYDHMMLDGLEDAYDKGRPMGFFAESCAEKYGFTRKQQDDYAISSFERAQRAIRENQFAAEIVPIIHHTKQGEQVIDTDEHPFSVNPEKIPKLSPVFIKEGTVTAGNASSIADGAAALVLMRLSEAEKRGIKPIARIVAHCSGAKAPSEFTTAPVDVTRKLMEKINWTVEEVDLFEVNEAFAVVTLAIMHDLHIPREKMNIHGGACALGHPIGATGARIIVTLLSALQQNTLKRGIASLCIGGGEATAIAVELY